MATKWNVEVIGRIYGIAVVEAESKEDAIDKLWEISPTPEISWDDVDPFTVDAEILTAHEAE